MDLEVAGRRVHAATGGAPFKPGERPVLFLHGAGLDHAIWALAGRFFTQRGHAVLAVDLPGHGRSEGPPLATIGAMAGWVLSVLDAAGVAEARLVGFSMGSAVAYEAARQAPERIRGLALIGAAPAMPVHPELLAAAKADDHRAIELMADWCHGRAGHYGGQPAPGLWVMTATVRILEQAAPGVLYADLAACDAFRAEGTVGVRAVLITGERDIMTPLKSARALAERMPRAELVVIPKAGHLVLSERPNATLDALARIA